MIQGLIAKKIIGVVIKKIMEKSELRKMRKYVEEDNELDKQMRVVQKNLNKYGKVIEEMEKEVAILKKDSHVKKDFVTCECCKKSLKNKRR